MSSELWAIIGSIAAIAGVLVAIIFPVLAWKSKKAKDASSPNRKSVEQLESLFFQAAYSAHLLSKGGEIDESLHVQKFKDCSFKMHQIATVMIERNNPNSSIGNAVIEFYDAFRQKQSLTVCKERLEALKKLV
ncbi:hypothetical protein [Microbulbifer agarilyticus]